MLSAFTARPVVELKQRDKSKIECILAYGDRLLVGLNTGVLRIYRVNEIPDEDSKQNGSKKPSDQPSDRPSSSTAPAKPVDLLREVEKFSPRAVEQLARIKEAGVLISLSNYYVSIHDLQTFSLQEQLSKTKNATTFAVTSNIVKDPATGIPEIISRLAVAVKRKLILWSWHESELSSETVEIVLSDSIRTLTWSTATKIICGMNSGYVIVDILTQEIEDIVGPGAIGGIAGNEAAGRFGGFGSASMGYMGLGGYIPKPLATKLAEGHMLLAKDVNSLFIDTDGKPIDKKQIPWQQAPESIGYSYPYMLALQPPARGSLEVRNPETLSLLQTISVPNATQLHFPPPTVSLAHDGKGFHVHSERGIWRMAATNYDKQIDELVDQARYDEAVSILNMLEDALLKDKDGRIREVKMLKAQMLFDQRKYYEAMNIFIDVSAPPERVIKLYPPVIAGDLSATNPEEKDDDIENGEDGKEVTKEDSNGNGAEVEESLSSSPGNPAGGPSTPTKNAAATAIRAHEKTHLSAGSPTKPSGFSKFLKHRAAQTSDTASIKSGKKEDISDPVEAEGSRGKIQEKSDNALEGKDLTNAVLELNAFLVHSRTRLQRFLDPVTGNLKPADVNGQAISDKQALESLLVAPSEAEIDREQKLRETAKLVDTTLFRAYMFARPTLAGALFRLPNFCDPDVVNEKLLETNRYQDLVDFFHGKKLHRQALELLKKFGEPEEEDPAAPMLHGPQRTVGYLQNLPPEMIDLILEFAEWPLRKDPDLGMEVFLADTENAETLPRDRVVNYLQGIDVDLAVRYLEHMINELNDATPDFHNRLVRAYLQDLKGRDDRDSESWKGLMDRLVSFLRSSKQYSLSRAFGMIPREDPGFYEALAIILSNMGQHRQALEIYVFKLEDYGKAEEYCNRIHLTQDTPISSPLQTRRSSATDTDKQLPSIYHTLLSLYLTPPAPHKPNWPPALSLLSKHGSRLPASSTLDIIPSNLPVSELESYFQGRIRAANSVVNESRIVTGLQKSELRNAQSTLLLGDGVAGGHGGRNRRVVVTDERVCGVCHKRLGRSVVAALPGNEVVHYGCLSRAQGQRRTSASAGGSSGGMEALRALSA